MPTLVSFLWHMHQPFYKDVVGNSYVMPWAYLHATKDYLGMAELSGEFPDVHQTFNLVPSLLLQLDDYAHGKANDPLFDLAFAPAEALDDVDRARVVSKFFPVPVRTMVEPYPRYTELISRRHERLTVQELRDIQVWWTLVWMDQERRPADLVKKGREFTVEDQARLRDLVVQTIRHVVPAYRRQQESGTIEISTTPFYHPILPILVNSRVDDPRVPVDFHFPEDALEQLQRAHAFITERFGAPRGLWPSEGSVSEAMAELVVRAGFQWMATDEGILEKSGVHVYDGDRYRLYRPYRRGDLTIFFRDRNLSDLIGFHYMHGAARDSANDLLRRLKEIPDGSHVSIILDGENPWDYYPSSGREFLRFVYEGIQRDPALEAVTLSEARERIAPVMLDRLAPGSWAGANFGIWIGHPEDQEAWAWIVLARQALMETKGKVPQDQWDQAHEELLVAEGSDWMWWFGNDFTSDDDAVFDSLFRRHIGNIYRLLGLPEPERLDLPIKKSLGGKEGVMFQSS